MLAKWPYVKRLLYQFLEVPVCNRRKRYTTCACWFPLFQVHWTLWPGPKELHSRKSKSCKTSLRPSPFALLNGWYSCFPIDFCSRKGISWDPICALKPPIAMKLSRFLVPMKFMAIARSLNTASGRSLSIAVVWAFTDNTVRSFPKMNTPALHMPSEIRWNLQSCVKSLRTSTAVPPLHAVDAAVRLTLYQV